MAASVSQNGRFRAVFLSVIMVLMTQVGYTENMDFSIGLNQDTESKDTGGSTPALTPSVEGADLMVGDLMTDITFQYNASAASGSGSGSNSGTYNGNGTAWMVKDIFTGSPSGFPYYLTPIGNTLYFSASSTSGSGGELWKSDGTESGTVLVKDINSGSAVSSPNYLTAIGNTLYFSANDGTNGIELWKSDGTFSGTVMVKDIYSGSSGSSPSHLAVVGNTLYFSATDGTTNGIELWKSDGTASGTVMVKDIYSGSSSSSPNHLTAVGNTLYFSANDGPNGTELWKSDGTTSGTMMVKDIYSGSSGSSPVQLTAVGNTLYFQANDGTNGLELWKSDGTTSGTVLVKDIRSGGQSAYPVQLTPIGNTLYFRAHDGTNGAELWKSDGTESGTVMVKDIRSGNSLPNYLTAAGNTLYFSATDGSNGVELWKSDGTTSGTVMVRDINSGSSGSDAIYLTAVGNTVYFRANDGTNGTELWKSDGTTSGTVMVQDINSGGNAGPRQSVLAGNTLYFQATDGSSGGELWALDPANITGLSGGSGSGGGMTNVTGATCTVSPSLPTGLSIDSNTCTISGTPSVATSNTTYTVTANISGTTYQGTVWLSSAYEQLTPSVEGADLLVGDLMDDITFQYNASAASGSGSGSSSTSSFAYANDKLAAGTCGIVDNGDLKCWGSDGDGQLGDGGQNLNTNAPPTTAIYLGTGRTAVAVSAGNSHVCAILDNGDLTCWGDDLKGQLGDGGSNTDRSTPQAQNPIDLGTGRTAVAVSAGGPFNTCAILDNGDLKCWGSDLYGQLGNGGNITADQTSPPSTAIDLGTGRTAVAVSTGWYHVCAILDNGDLKCWGRDDKGQLGIGGYTSINEPSTTAIDLGTGRTAVAVSAGAHHTCAILDNGDLKCWGDASYGQLGHDGNYTITNVPSTTAIDLGTGRTAVAVSLGRFYSCAILDNGEAKCWGRDGYGELGDGGGYTNTNAPSTTAIDFGTGRTAVALSSGDYQSCAILDNGDMKCWGYNSNGELGDGGNTNQPSPVAVSGSNSWNSSTGVSSGSGSGMTNVTGATCSISPALPTGLSMNSSTCTISGTPSVVTSNTTYTVTSNISGTTYQGTVWLAIVPFGTITSPVMGAELDLSEAMTPITLNYTSQAGNATVYNGNGTAWMVKEICPGQGASYQGSGPTYITTIGDTLYFHANDCTHGRELWKSDGTEAGTVMVKDITPGTLASGGTRNTNMNYFAAVGDTLYFAADDQIHGTELWKSDGTEAGTVMVKDLQPGSYSSGTPKSGGAGYITAIGETVYFLGDDGVNGSGLYKSDGTANGTVFVFRISGSELVVAGNTLYFTGKEVHVANSEYGLYKSDGTANGTVFVKDINPNGQVQYEIHRLTPVGDKIYFGGNDGTHGNELWVSDGTANGTFMVKDINQELGVHQSSYPFGTNGPTPRPVVAGNNFYFVAEVNSSINKELWKSDGTEAGTVLVADLCTGWHTNWFYSAFGDTVFFPNRCSSSSISSSGGEIWRSDGTASGTVLETNSVLANGVSGDHTFTPMGNILYFSGQSGTDDYELWAYSPTNVTLNTPPPVSWETYPALPAGMSISNGVISGTPTVYAVNQTYTIYANQSGETTTFDMYFSVDTNNPHTVVENQPIDPIGFHGPFQNGTTNWTVSPALPADLVMDPNTGEITGSVNGVLANTTYTVTATHSDSATEEFSFSLQSLADFDGDGLANELPSDYDAAEGPTSGLVADTDDDADGLEDVVETGTNLYVDSNNTGSNPLDPDTDDDGICDGPNAVPPICIAGPDSTPNGDSGPPTWIGLFGKEMNALGPYKTLPGGTYEIMPDLPQSLTMDPNTGVISGTPTQTLDNTTFTVWANRSDGASLSWNFTIEILADSDGDGFPDELPEDYDPSNPASPGLVEDLDDDNDGISDLEEEAGGTDSTNPDTDGDGMCDGPVAVDPECVAGPDAFPLDPSADTDTDGDGDPDTITGNSTSIPALVEDFDDDGDGVEDVNETGTWTYNGPTDTGTNPLNPDTDYDGVCDGPVDVYHPQTGDLICVAGPDTDLGNLAVGGHYAVNGSVIEPIRPEYIPSGAVWEISPALPADLMLHPVSGVVYGTANEVTENITYTIYGNGTVSDYTSTFNLQILEDTDRDGEPNELPEDYDNSTVTPMVEDLDDDGDGLSDLAETGTGFYNGTSDYGTDPLNPDTDGDGVCDGPNSVWPICINGPDSNPFGTHDGGNIVLVENIAIETPIPPPNQVPGAVWEISPALPAGLNLNTSSGIITGTATEVSDNTTYTLWANVSDFGRSDSVALSVMATFGLTVLEDSDGDGMPDELPDDYDENIGILVEDDDDDNDGLLDTEEDALGTDPTNPDTDGDGFCDGPSDVYAADGTLVCRGPDSAPLDSALPVDTDGDMFPDEDPDGPGGLEADTDDDGDGFSDEEENNCGSNPLDANDAPTDLDGDTICDMMDADIDGDGLNNTVETNTGIYISSEDSGSDPLNPDTDGDGYCDGPVSPNYSDCIAGPDAFPTDASAHLDTDGDGAPDTITGNSTTGLVEDLDDDGDGVFDSVEAGCGTDSLDASETPELDSDGNCVKQEASAESLLDWNWGWCFCLILLLLLLLLIPIVMQRDRILLMLADGPEPENTTSEPEFVSGAGTLEDPFILAPAEGVKAGKSVTSTEVITIDKMTVSNVDMVDFYDEDNGNKFSMFETGFDEIGVRIISVGEDGEITINVHFDDAVDGATYAGGEFTGLLKLGSASVYLSWTVTVEPDKKKLKEIEKAEKEAKKADEEAAAKEAEEEAAREAEEAEAKKKADAEVKAKKEAEAKAKKEAEEEAAAAALLAKEEEEKAAKKKSEEEAAAKPATKEEKKKAELKRVKERSKSIDFKVLGTAKASDKDDLQVIKGIGPFIEEKLNALGIYTYLQVSKMTSKLEDTVNEAIEFFPGRVKRDQWVAQAKIKIGEDVELDEKALKKAEELERVAKKAEKIDFGTIGVASASDKDNLQELKGIGPFIEEKLNALGIFKFEQIAKMTSKIEDEVNIAIEFFPGRVKRDEWVKQAKERSKK